VGRRPTHKPCDKIRGKVETLAALGRTNKYIAYEIGVSVDTLVKYYADELEHGAEKLDSKVMSQLARFAAGDPGNKALGIPPTAAVPRVTMFWAERRCGMVRTERLEHSGKLSVAEIMAGVDLEDDDT
jgi:hypothetical protein